MRSIKVYSMKDREDVWSDTEYYTIEGLRRRTLNDWLDEWETIPTEEMREKLKTDDEYLFDWLNGWGYNIENVLTIPEEDFPKS